MAPAHGGRILIGGIAHGIGAALFEEIAIRSTKSTERRPPCFTL
jgi:hypothetical protein